MSMEINVLERPRMLWSIKMVLALPDGMTRMGLVVGR